MCPVYQGVLIQDVLNKAFHCIIHVYYNNFTVRQTVHTCRLLCSLRKKKEAVCCYVHVDVPV